MATLLNCGKFSLPSSRQFDACFSAIFFPKIAKSQKFFIVVQFRRRRPYSKLQDKTYKRPPMAKRLQMTDKAEQVTLIRRSRPNPPTTSVALFSLPLTRSQNPGGRFFCYDWLASHSQLHKTIIERTTALTLPASF